MVEFGCGEGFFALPAARIAGSSGKVIGIDINGGAVSRMLEKAGGKASTIYRGSSGAVKRPAPVKAAQT